MTLPSAGLVASVFYCLRCFGVDEVRPTAVYTARDSVRANMRGRVPRAGLLVPGQRLAASLHSRSQQETLNMSAVVYSAYVYVVVCDCDVFPPSLPRAVALCFLLSL